MQASLERNRQGARRPICMRAASTRSVLATFEAVSRKRNGRGGWRRHAAGVCTICHVRLRPQVFNTVLRNDSILQCDHCNPDPLLRAGAAAAANRAVGSHVAAGVRDRSRGTGQGLPFDDSRSHRPLSSPTSTAGRAAIPVRPASASGVEDGGRHAHRRVRRSRSASPPTTSRNIGRCSPRSSGPDSTAAISSMSDPIRSCSSSRCSATTR
jgi:hypothetical protein